MKTNLTQKKNNEATQNNHPQETETKTENEKRMSGSTSTIFLAGIILFISELFFTFRDKLFEASIQHANAEMIAQKTQEFQILGYVFGTLAAISLLAICIIIANKFNKAEKGAQKNSKDINNISS